MKDRVPRAMTSGLHHQIVSHQVIQEQEESVAGSVFEVLDIPAGESAIYTVTGQLGDGASASYVATVAPGPQHRELDYRDNVFPRQEAANVTMALDGELVTGEQATVEIAIKNLGPDRIDFRIDEPLTRQLTNTEWTSTMAPFPDSIAVDNWLPSYGPMMGMDGAQSGTLASPVMWDLGDVNGDGLDDLFILDSGLHLGHPEFGRDGNLGVPIEIAATNEFFVGAHALGDINRDGLADFLLHRYKNDTTWTHLYLGSEALSQC